MAEARTDPRRRVVQDGIASNLLTTFAQAIKWLVLSLLFSIVIEWIGMTLWWPEQGLGHSRDMLGAEIGYLQADFGRSLVSPNPAAFTKDLADRVYYVLFEFTRIADLVTWLGRPANPDDTGLRVKLHRLFAPLAAYVLAAIQITQVFSVRLAILVLAMPVFVLFSVVAVVDGLVRRDLRRWGGGRESSFVYHWAKRTAVPLLVLTWVVYLSLPFSVHPSLVVLPFAVLFAFSVAVTAGSFKKYL